MAAKLKAFTDAYAAVMAAAVQDSGVAAVLSKQDRTGECTTDANETGMSFAGAQAMLTKHPRVGSIYAAQGISPRELVIWSKPAVMFVFASQPQAAAAALGELSPAQQAFARDNTAGIERLTKVITSAMKQGQR